MDNEDIIREENVEYEQAEFPSVEEELASRIADRKRVALRRKKRNRRLMVLGMILTLAILITMCGREIIRLKAENYSLRKQQEELIAERDRLQEELKNVGNRDYIKEQARKQLRLLDPGEIMFVFEDD